MNFVLNNPYRILGLLVGASAREETRQYQSLKRYIEAEQDPREDFSFQVFGNLIRTLKSVEEAVANLNLAADRINAALFWFWKGNPITDEVAFDSIKEGNSDEAIQIWRSLIYDDYDDFIQITKRNASAYFNLSTYYLANYPIDKETIQLKLVFLESDFVQDFISDATDSAFKISKEELQLKFLQSLVQYFNIGQNDLFEAISDIEFISKDSFVRGLLQKPIEQIEREIEIAKDKRKSNKANSAGVGNELYNNTSNQLIQLRKVVGSKDVRYYSIADKVANEILQCCVDYVNENNEKSNNSRYLETALNLAHLAKNIAVGKLTRDRINDNINTIEELKDREILHAILLLESVKSAYESNESRIRDEVREIELNDPLIRIGHRKIDKNAVESHIKNSVDWNKVNGLIIEVLSEKNLIKIKESDKNEKKAEFLTLALWLKQYSQKPSIISSILEKYNKIPPKLPFKIICSTLTHTDQKNNPLPITIPFYKKHTRFIGLKLDVECFENKTVTIFVKYIGPNGQTATNGTISQNGFTKHTTINISPDTRVINLLGWGNSVKCSYSIGKHTIEVYYDNFLIHSKLFAIDLAPSEKLELELKKAEKKLDEIKNSQFFTKELESINTEIENTMKWQFLRSQSEREKQIIELQQKRNYTYQRAENEKAIEIHKQLSKIKEIKFKIQNAEY